MRTSPFAATIKRAGLFRRAARVAVILFAFTLTFVSPRSVDAAFTSFGTGSLIIPMDTGPRDGQDYGMLTAYGLVYELLRDGVPVYWVINSRKLANGGDFAIAFDALQDVRTGAAVSPRPYRGGPFVIAASDAAAALPIIHAWQSVPGDQTTVHRFIGEQPYTTSFSGEVSRLLVRAPRIAILKDGSETIAFNDLNAARIPDSIGNIWSSSSPDLLTEGDLTGPTSSYHRDGVLFVSPLMPRFGFLVAMHYNASPATSEVVSEVRQWLSTSGLLHFYAQCEAIRTFEDASDGLFLTYAGIDDDGVATSNPVIRVPADPLTQLDGTFEVDSGSVDSMRANPSGGPADYKPGVTTLINDSSSSLLQRITYMTGRLDGQFQDGQVTYLAGHDYAVDLPITSNPQTNGVRLFLDALLKSDCAATTAQPDLTLTKTAPALTAASEIPYTITLGNPLSATAPAENVVVTDAIPAGTTYVAGSGSTAPTTNSGGVLTWNLPPLAPGASTTITFRVSVTSDGAYLNTAYADFANVMVRTIQSSPAFTLRDATRPVVTIPVPPNRTSFGIPTPSFIFNVSENPVSTQCAIDNAPFISCSSPYTAAPLLDGVHTFNVRATDPAGNTGGAGIIFSVASITIGVTPGCTDGHCPPTFTIQASRPVSHDVTVYYRMTGPGVFGIDYTVAGTFGQVVIPAGQTWASVNLIRLPGDRFVKGKTTTMRLVATPDYTVNPNHIIATVFIFRNH